SSAAATDRRRSMTATRRRPMTPVLSSVPACCWGQCHLRGRLLIVVRTLAGFGDLDPAMLALGALRNHRAADGGAFLIRQPDAEAELVVDLVRQAAATPDDLADVLGHGRAVIVVRLVERLDEGFELPPGLRHRLGLDDADRDPHADCGCRRRAAAVA